MAEIQLIGQFYDMNNNLFKVKIYRPDYPSDPEYTIQYSSGRQSLTRNHGGGGKNAFESTIIQGQELIYNFFMPRADISNMDYLLESQYKDYVVVLYDVGDSEEEEIFRGYLKPENLVKRYETNIPNIEIQLSATDSLGELDYFEFNDSEEELIIGDYTALEVIKKCIEKISDPGGLGLDFRIQLGTYEKNLMDYDECALGKVMVDTRAFVVGELEEKKSESCYTVITRLLKPFNAFLKQEKGYYVITNPHELGSKEFTFDWGTLTKQSRTDANNIKDISNNYYTPYIEQQKVHPLKCGYVTHRNYIIVDELLSDDWNDWIGGNWSSDEIDDRGHLLVTKNNFDSDTDPEPFFTQKDRFYVAKPSSGVNYLIFRFMYTLTDIFYYMEGDATGTLMWKIEIQGPEDIENNTWRTPTYRSIFVDQKNYPIEVVSNFNEPYKITESGDYNIKVTLHVEGGNIEMDVSFSVQNPSMKIYPLSDKAEVESSKQEYEGWGGPRPSSTMIIRDERSVRETSSRSSNIDAISGRSGRRSDPVKDRTYKLEQPNGYEIFEADLHFADGVSEGTTESGAFMINDTMTSVWSRYGTSESISLIYVYLMNVIDNRQKYKNYLRCTIIDMNHEIEFNNILTIEGKNYFILQYFRDYRNGMLEAELIELITDKLTYETGIEEVEKTSISAADSIVPALVKEGEFQPYHGLKVGDVVRYDFINKKYVKAQADTAEHAKAVGVVSNFIDSDKFKFISDGYVRSDTALYTTLKSTYNLEEGEYYFLDPNNAGGMLKAADLSTGDIEQCIGYVTTKGIKVQVDARYIQPPGVAPYVPRASSQALTTGDNYVRYKAVFPANSTVIILISTYDSNGYQVGNSVSNETIEGFTINVPKNCTLKYIATKQTNVTLFANSEVVFANDNMNITANGTTQSIEAWFDYINEEFGKLYAIYTQ